MSSKRSSSSEQKPVFTGRLTLKAVNQALADAGAKEILVRGNGYHYFAEGGAPRWPTSMVMKPRLSDYTLEQWVIVWRNMRADHARNLEMSYLGDFGGFRSIHA